MSQTVSYNGKTRTLMPVDELKENIDGHLRDNGYTREQFPFNLLKLNHKLYDQIRLYGVKMFGHPGIKPVLEAWGYQHQRQRSNDELLQFFREKLVTQERAEEIFSERKTGKRFGIQKFFYSLGEDGKDGRYFYVACHNAMRKEHSEQMMQDIINSAYPALHRKYGMTLYDAIAGNIPHTAELRDLCTEIYFSGQDCTRAGLSLASENARVVLALRTNKYASVKKKSKRSSSRNVLGSVNKEEERFLQRFAKNIHASITPYDMHFNQGGVNQTARIAEQEVSLMLHIAKKYDPEFRELKELLPFLKPPLTKICSGWSNLSYNDHNHKGVADGRLNSGGLEVLIETKSGIISHDKMQKMLTKHRGAKWSDGKDIESKLAVFNTNRMSVADLSGMLYPEFLCMDLDTFSAAYAHSIELLERNDPDFFSKGIPHSPELLLEIHKMVSKTPYILNRNMHENLRSWMHDILSQDISQFRGERFQESVKVEDDVRLPLKKMAHFYTKDQIKKLSTISLPHALFVDIETTGFNHGGSLIGIIGMVYDNNEGLVAEQAVSVNPLSERDALNRLIEVIKDHGIERIVYFNGKSFDGPFLKRRMHAHLIRECLDLPVCDLYFDAFKRLAAMRRYEDATLQTFERTVLGISRKDDISGKDIPKALDEMMHGAPGKNFFKALDHNMLDVITMVLMHDYLQEKGMIKI